MKALLCVVAQAKIVVVKSEVEKPIVAVASPIIKPFEVGVGLAEEFALHLLKFTYSEYEVAGVISFLEGFTYLTNAEGNLFLVVLWIFWKFTNIPCAVSGLK